MEILAIIPARYASSRFEGKPLADLHGKPMLWWVYNQVKKVENIDNVIVAIDDVRVEDVCKKYNLNYMFTSSDHMTSTERLHEVSKSYSADYYICINGDEPLIDPEVIKEIIPENITQHLYVSNLMVKMSNPSEVMDNTNIKVVFNKAYEAIFMSRSVVPFPKSSLDFSYYKHIGVLCYTKLALDFFANTSKGLLESVEDINELRYLENGIRIKMVEVETKVLSVDTPKDLEYVKQYIASNL